MIKISIVANPDNPAASAIQDAHAEWVLQVTGLVRRHPAGAENPILDLRRGL